MSGRCRIVALHGFLGRASDWESLAGWFPEASMTALDLWPLLALPDAADWPSAGRSLDRALTAATSEGDGPVFVVAYSFGARLALASALLSAPGSPVRGCCFVSCNPGFAAEDEDARAARRASDEAWARRLLESREPEIWREWDAQPVFNGSRTPGPRAGLPAPRTALAGAMRRFSLGTQPDFRSRLRAWPSPVLWVTGALDTKFSAIARELASAGVPAAYVWCESAGHRVPWDDPPAFAGAVREWIDRVMEKPR